MDEYKCFNCPAEQIKPTCSLKGLFVFSFISRCFIAVIEHDYGFAPFPPQSVSALFDFGVISFLTSRTCLTIIQYNKSNLSSLSISPPSSISVSHTPQSRSDSPRFLRLQRYWRLMTAIPERRLRLWHCPFFPSSLCALVAFPSSPLSEEGQPLSLWLNYSICLAFFPARPSLGLNDESLTPAVVSGMIHCHRWCMCECVSVFGLESLPVLSLCSIMQFNFVWMCVWVITWVHLCLCCVSLLYPFGTITGLQFFSISTSVSFIVFLHLIHFWTAGKTVLFLPIAPVLTMCVTVHMCDTLSWKTNQSQMWVLLSNEQEGGTRGGPDGECEQISEVALKCEEKIKGLA